MASIFKRKRLKPIPRGSKIKEGKQGQKIAEWRTASGGLARSPLNDVGNKIIVEDKKYTISYFDHTGKRLTVKGTVDKQATERIAAKVETDVDLRRRGVLDATQETLSQQANAPIDLHLDAFEQSLIAKNNTDEHIRRIRSHLTRMIEYCKFETARSIEVTRFEGFIVTLLNGKNGKSARTINAYITSAKHFASWLWTTNRIATNPLAGLKVDRKREEKDRRYVRRAIGNAEVDRLVNAALHGSVWTWRQGGGEHGISGFDRAMLYRVVLGTGLRAGEVANLTPSAFRLSSTPPVIVALAAYAKGGRTDSLPISDDLTAILRPWLVNKPAGQPVFKMPPSDRTADMLRFDMTAGNVPIHDAEGRVFDFHALRGQYITSLGKSGAPQVVVQSLARHSDFKTTRRYLDITLADSAAAVNKLPTPGTSGETAIPMRATGTDDTVPPLKLGQQFGQQFG